MTHGHGGHHDEEEVRIRRRFSFLFNTKLPGFASIAICPRKDRFWHARVILIALRSRVFAIFPNYVGLENM